MPQPYRLERSSAHAPGRQSPLMSTPVMLGHPETVRWVHVNCGRVRHEEQREKIWTPGSGAHLTTSWRSAGSSGQSSGCGSANHWTCSSRPVTAGARPPVKNAWKLRSRARPAASSRPCACSG